MSETSRSGVLNLLATVNLLELMRDFFNILDFQTNPGEYD